VRRGVVLVSTLATGGGLTVVYVAHRLVGLAADAPHGRRAGDRVKSEPAIYVELEGDGPVGRHEVEGAHLDWFEEAREGVFDLVLRAESANEDVGHAVGVSRHEVRRHRMERYVPAISAQSWQVAVRVRLGAVAGY